MYVLPNPATEMEVTAAFADCFDDVQKRLGIKGKEWADFRKFLIRTTARYLELKRANPKRLTPPEQNERLDGYGKAVEGLRTAYKKIRRDNPTDAKFHVALRTEYERQTPQMQKMLQSYMDDSGYKPRIFLNFLDVLTRIAESAKTTKVGKDKADVSKDYFLWWVAEIRWHWPKSPKINITYFSAITFLNVSEMRLLLGIACPS